MENNKIKYEISIGNLYNEIFQKLKMNKTERKIIDSMYDPNNKKTKFTTQTVKTVYDWIGINKMILKQYFINDQYFEYYEMFDKIDKDG